MNWFNIGVYLVVALIALFIYLDWRQIRQGKITIQVDPKKQRVYSIVSWLFLTSVLAVLLYYWHSNGFSAGFVFALGYLFVSGIFFTVLRFVISAIGFGGLMCSYGWHQYERIRLGGRKTFTGTETSYLAVNGISIEECRVCGDIIPKEGVSTVRDFHNGVLTFEPGHLLKKPKMHRKWWPRGT